MNEPPARERILEAQGWKRQFIASEPRLTEAAAMYGELGFEVLLEPIPAEAECSGCRESENDESSKCWVCFQGREEEYKIIYTRPYTRADALSR